MHLEFSSGSHRFSKLTDPKFISLVETLLQGILKIPLHDKKVILRLDRQNRQKWFAPLADDEKVCITVEAKGKTVFSGNLTIADLVNQSDKNGIIRINITTNVIDGFLAKPVVEGEFSADAKKNTSPRFAINEIREQEYPFISVKNIPAEMHTIVGARIKILLSGAAHNALVVQKQYSKMYEEGGFLVGDVYLEEENPACHIIKITGVLEASKVGASPVRLVFTADAFSEIKAVLRTTEMAGKRLLGWYHSHLFPAGAEEVELSDMDLNLHFSTFRFPWQVAALVNLEWSGTPTLRFYARVQDTWEMEEIAYCITG